MVILFYAATILLTLGYAFIILILYRGLTFLKSGKNNFPYRVSVIVAARNEENNIGNCIQALLDQNYPADHYEIIIVDDRSTDNTASIVKEVSLKHASVRLIQATELPPGIAPKKHALARGIDAATGEIICTTDADCIPASGWIQAMVSCFEPEVGLVAGFSPLEESSKKSLFQKLFTLDSLSLAAVAAGSFGLGKPLTCNGRNLAYRKETFRSVNGFKEIQTFISGDDDLFLHQVQQRTNWEMRYAIDCQSVVRSKAPSHLKEFINQRIRHASKGRYYPPWLKWTLVGVYLLNFNLILLIPVSFFSIHAFLVWIACLGIKSANEFLLLNRMGANFNYTKILNTFPIAMFLHPFYVVIFGLWGQLGEFKWKDETYQATTASRSKEF
jgi:cellulose synthase/poly-beta-1,6-N-acetylglucosamine synthase-like glycosyltransferase